MSNNNNNNNPTTSLAEAKKNFFQLFKQPATTAGGSSTPASTGQRTTQQQSRHQQQSSSSTSSASPLLGSASLSAAVLVGLLPRCTPSEDSSLSASSPLSSSPTNEQLQLDPAIRSALEKLFASPQQRRCAEANPNDDDDEPLPSCNDGIESADELWKKLSHLHSTVQDSVLVSEQMIVREAVMISCSQAAHHQATQHQHLDDGVSDGVAPAASSSVNIVLSDPSPTSSVVEIPPPAAAATSAVRIVSSTDDEPRLDQASSLSGNGRQTKMDVLPNSPAEKTWTMPTVNGLQEILSSWFPGIAQLPTLFLQSLVNDCARFTELCYTRRRANNAAVATIATALWSAKYPVPAVDSALNGITNRKQLFDQFHSWIESYIPDSKIVKKKKAPMRRQRSDDDFSNSNTTNSGSGGSGGGGVKKGSNSNNSNSNSNNSEAFCGVHVDERGFRYSARILEQEALKRRKLEAFERKRRRQKGYFPSLNVPTSFSPLNDVADETMGTVTNMAVVAGAVGSGTTSFVFELAQSFGVRVVEINTSVRRNSVSLEKLVSETTQARQIQTTGVPTTSAHSELEKMQAVFATKISNEKNSTNNNNNKTTSATTNEQKNKEGTAPPADEKSSSASAVKSKSKDPSAKAPPPKKGLTQNDINNFFALKPVAKPSTAKSTQKQPQGKSGVAAPSAPASEPVAKAESSCNSNSMTIVSSSSSLLEASATAAPTPKPSAKASSSTSTSASETAGSKKEEAIEISPMQQKDQKSAAAPAAASTTSTTKPPAKPSSPKQPAGKKGAKQPGAKPAGKRGRPPAKKRARPSSSSSSSNSSSSSDSESSSDDSSSSEESFDTDSDASSLDPAGSGLHAIVLVESGDVVSSDEGGFHSALRHLASDSKCPVIVTAEEDSADSFAATLGVPVSYLGASSNFVQAQGPGIPGSNGGAGAALSLHQGAHPPFSQSSLRGVVQTMFCFCILSCEVELYKHRCQQQRPPRDHQEAQEPKNDAAVSKDAAAQSTAAEQHFGFFPSMLQRVLSSIADWILRRETDQATEEVDNVAITGSVPGAALSSISSSNNNNSNSASPLPGSPISAGPTTGTHIGALDMRRMLNSLQWVTLPALSLSKMSAPSSSSSTGFANFHLHEDCDNKEAIDVEAMTNRVSERLCEILHHSSFTKGGTTSLANTPMRNPPPSSSVPQTHNGGGMSILPPEFPPVASGAVVVDDVDAASQTQHRHQQHETAEDFQHRYCSNLFSLSASSDCFSKSFDVANQDIQLATAKAKATAKPTKDADDDASAKVRIVPATVKHFGAHKNAHWAKPYCTRDKSTVFEIGTYLPHVKVAVKKNTKPA